MSQPFSIMWKHDIVDALHIFNPARLEVLYDRLFEALSRHVGIAINLAISVVPVKTGRLQAAIGFITVDREGLFIIAGTQGVYYALYIEFGTSKMSARPFWRPYIWQAFYDFRDEATTIVAGWANGE